MEEDYFPISSKGSGEQKRQKIHVYHVCGQLTHVVPQGHTLNSENYSKVKVKDIE